MIKNGMIWNANTPPKSSKSKRREPQRKFNAGNNDGNASYGRKEGKLVMKPGNHRTFGQNWKIEYHIINFDKHRGDLGLNHL